MPSLIITSAGDKGWVARLANSDLEWPFTGNNLTEQFLNLQDFAQFMERGDMIGACENLVRAEIGEGLEATAETVFSTDSLVLEGRVIFAAAEEGAALLIEAIVVAGARLGQALLALG